MRCFCCGKELTTQSSMAPLLCSCNKEHQLCSACWLCFSKNRGYTIVNLDTDPELPPFPERIRLQVLECPTREYLIALVLSGSGNEISIAV